ncbi:hypothetical protein ACFV16_38170 [Streptomyces massasporeus]|uniref:hypothetical protein n=1 Tax=Streptomyces massasporeus TaxID=67324 RepID=UPI00368F3DA7
MRWPDEVRSPEKLLLPPPVEPSDEEIDGALALMDGMINEDLAGEEVQDSCAAASSRAIGARREDSEPPELQEPDRRRGRTWIRRQP